MRFTGRQAHKKYMNHQELNLEEPEEELVSPTSPLVIPCKLKLILSAIFSLLILFCSFIVWSFIVSPSTAASPAEIGITPIFIFSITILVALWVPWQQLGVRITKIGGIEFEKIVAEQASEHAEEVTYLQDRIETLEKHVHRLDETSELIGYFAEPELRELLLKFLTQHSKWAFSPTRIRAWGSKQQGFSALETYDYHFIRTTLQKMVSNNILETRISKKGNTLYRIPNI